jgi:hypothetical protein
MPYTDVPALKNITYLDFQNYFDDFDYKQITSQKINRGFSEAYLHFNPSLFSSNDMIVNAFLYLTAHYIVIALRNKNINVMSVGREKVSSTETDNVKEDYVIPERFRRSPLINFLSKTDYGQMYLSYALPALVGTVFSTYGRTHAI